MATTTVDIRSINRACIQGFAVGILNNPRYLPQNKSKEFLLRDRVKKTIEGEGRFASYDADKLQSLVDYSIENPSIFLTLVMTKLIKKMPILLSGKFGDRHLPVRKEYDDKTDKMSVYSIYPSGGRQNSPWECFVDGDDEMNEWDGTDLDSFVLHQWAFLTAVFEDKRFEYEIYYMQPLPYVNVAATTAARGHFGKVFKLGLLPEHCKVSFERDFPTVRQMPTHPHHVFS